MNQRVSGCHKCPLPSFLLLHEGLGCVKLWRSFPERLAAATGCRVLAYDRQGHGKAEPLEQPWPKNWLEQEALVALPRMMDQLELDRPILLGHSDGGTLALMAATAFPERVSGVVTLAAHAFVDAKTIQGVEAAGRAFLQGDLARRLARHHGENTEPMFKRWHDTWLSEEHRSWTLVPQLRRITCPVLTIQGLDDPYGLPSQAEVIAGETSGKCVLLPGCGHAPHLEATDSVLHAIQAWQEEHWEKISQPQRPVWHDAPSPGSHP